MRGLNFCIKPCTRRIQCTILVSTTTLHRYKGRITSNLKQYCHQKSQEYMRTSLKLEKENSLNIYDMFLQVKLTYQIPGDNTEKIWAHRFLAKTKQLQLEGGPERCPGGSKAPFFFFYF